MLPEISLFLNPSIFISIENVCWLRHRLNHKRLIEVSKLNVTISMVPDDAFAFGVFLCNFNSKWPLWRIIVSLNARLKLTANVLLFYFTYVNVKVTGCYWMLNFVVALRYSIIHCFSTGPNVANETRAWASVLVHRLLEPPFSSQVVF